MRFVLASLATLALLLPALPAPAQSTSPTLSRILKNKELRVGMSGAQPPLNVKDKQGNVIGIEADLAYLLAASMDVKLTIVTKPFPELLPALNKGEVDMVMSGVTITPERNLKNAFVGPYFISGKSILTTSAALAKATDPEAINEGTLTLAALRGSTSQRFVEAVAPDAKLETVDDYEQGIALVLDGKADALVADYPICVLSLLRHQGKGLATLVRPFTIEPIGIALPGDDPLAVNLVDNYLRALEGSGLLDALKARYLEDGSWLAELP